MDHENNSWHFSVTLFKGFYAYIQAKDTEDTGISTSPIALCKDFFCISFWFLTFFGDTGLCFDCDSDKWWHFSKFPSGVTEGTSSLSKHLISPHPPPHPPPLTGPAVHSLDGYYREWLPTIKKCSKAIKIILFLDRLTSQISSVKFLMDGHMNSTAPSNLFRPVSVYNLKMMSNRTTSSFFVFYRLFNMYCMDRSMR